MIYSSRQPGPDLVVVGGGGVVVVVVESFVAVAALPSYQDVPFGSLKLAVVEAASPGLPTVAEDFDVGRSSSVVEAVPEGAAGHGEGYPAGGAAAAAAAAWFHRHQPSSLVDHFGLAPCVPVQQPLGRGPVEEFLVAPPSLPAPCVRWPFGGPGLVDGEAASSLPVSAAPSSFEHRQPAGFSLQFLLLQVGAQMGAAVAVAKQGLGPEADWEDVGLRYFQAS